MDGVCQSDHNENTEVKEISHLLSNVLTANRQVEMVYVTLTANEYRQFLKVVNNHRDPINFYKVPFKKWGWFVRFISAFKYWIHTI